MGLQQSSPARSSKSTDLPERIDSIISSNRKFDLDALKVEHETYTVTEEIEDETRGLKNVATEFVVNEFFKTSDSLYNFLSTVNDTFETALDIYRDRRGLDRNAIFFVWKGGNILLLVEKQFLEELPEYANKAIRKFYAPFFKRSDCDFAIYVHPDLDDYEEIYHEMTLLAYQVQDHLRETFRADISSYFDLFKYNEEYRLKLCKHWLGKFSAETGVKYSGFTTFRGGPDLTMRFVQDDYQNSLANSREVARASVKNARSMMKITHNHLDFPNPNGKRVRFNLTRTKAFFKLSDENGDSTLVGGELIDCSISHRTDYNIPHFFEDLDKNLATYTLRVDDDSDITFVSLSISYLTDDLITILFRFNEFPWDDNKYSKRMNRLMYLYFVDIFIKLKNAHLRLKVLQGLRTMLTDFDIETFRRLHGKRGLNINEFLDQIESLVERAGQSDELEKLRLLLNQNVDFLVQTIENLHVFCSTDGNATEEDVYAGKLNALV